MIAITNLYPRPDEPTRGLYNLRLFRELAAKLPASSPLLTLCLVPEWRPWRWRGIRQWSVARKQGLEPEVVYLPVFYLPLLGRNLSWWFYTQAIRRWRGRHGELDATSDIIYSPWLYPDGVAAAQAARGRGTRLWLMALGSDTFHLQVPARRQKILEACVQAEGVICVSNQLADRLASAGVPRTKLHVVPNGVDKSVFCVRANDDHPPPSEAHPPSPHSTAPRFDRASPLVLFVGNLVPVKAPDVLVEAFATATDSADNSPHLLMIGSGEMLTSLEQLAAKLGIADRVHFLGRLPPEQVARWMNRADLLCLASRSEGMPNVVLEARASGLPVVTTPAGAVPELPLDRHALLVARSGSPEDLAKALCEMLSRPPAPRIADPAVPTWSQMADRVLELVGA